MITDDEFAVLGIAIHGQYMAPIGRWKAPVESLHSKGFLEKKNDVNFTITDAGRQAFAERDQDDDAAIRQLLESNNKVANARTQAQQSVEQAARHLWIAARATSETLGDTYEHALREWGKEALERALEMKDQNGGT